MAQTPRTAASLIPPDATLPTLRHLAGGCTACPLCAIGTQTVFGEGPADAALMLVGETPGDREDRLGRPFVGPAGKLLDTCLERAGIDRKAAYVTNVVKHFKWTARNSRRVHVTPNAGEIRACRPWLEAEIALVKPRALACLGATAAKALLGDEFRVTRSRGQFVQSAWAPYVMATIHPSALLRIDDPRLRDEAIELFVTELTKIAEVAMPTARRAGQT